MSSKTNETIMSQPLQCQLTLDSSMIDFLFDDNEESNRGAVIIPAAVPMPMGGDKVSTAKLMGACMSFDTPPPSPEPKVVRQEQKQASQNQSRNVSADARQRQSSGKQRVESPPMSPDGPSMTSFPKNRPTSVQKQQQQQRQQPQREATGYGENSIYKQPQECSMNQNNGYNDRQQGDQSARQNYGQKMSTPMKGCSAADQWRLMADSCRQKVIARGGNATGCSGGSGCGPESSCVWMSNNVGILPMQDGDESMSDESGPPAMFYQQQQHQQHQQHQQQQQQPWGGNSDVNDWNQRNNSWNDQSTTGCPSYPNAHTPRRCAGGQPPQSGDWSDGSMNHCPSNNKNKFRSASNGSKHLMAGHERPGSVGFECGNDDPYGKDMSIPQMMQQSDDNCCQSTVTNFPRNGQRSPSPNMSYPSPAACKAARNPSPANAYPSPSACSLSRPTSGATSTSSASNLRTQSEMSHWPKANSQQQHYVSEEMNEKDNSPQSTTMPERKCSGSTLSAGDTIDSKRHERESRDPWKQDDDDNGPSTTPRATGRQSEKLRSAKSQSRYQYVIPRGPDEEDCDQQNAGKESAVNNDEDDHIKKWQQKRVALPPQLANEWQDELKKLEMTPEYATMTAPQRQRLHQQRQQEMLTGFQEKQKQQQTEQPVSARRVQSDEVVQCNQRTEEPQKQTTNQQSEDDGIKEQPQRHSHQQFSSSSECSSCTDIPVSSRQRMQNSQDDNYQLSKGPEVTLTSHSADQMLYPGQYMPQRTPSVPRQIQIPVSDGYFPREVLAPQTSSPHLLQGIQSEQRYPNNFPVQQKAMHMQVSPDGINYMPIPMQDARRENCEGQNWIQYPSNREFIPPSGNTSVYPRNSSGYLPNSTATPTGSTPYPQFQQGYSTSHPAGDLYMNQNSDYPPCGYMNGNSAPGYMTPGFSGSMPLYGGADNLPANTATQPRASSAHPVFRETYPPQEYFAPLPNQFFPGSVRGFGAQPAQSARPVGYNTTWTQQQEQANQQQLAMQMAMMQTQQQQQFSDTMQQQPPPQQQQQQQSQSGDQAQYARQCPLRPPQQDSTGRQCPPQCPPVRQPICTPEQQCPVMRPASQYPPPRPVSQQQMRQMTQCSSPQKQYPRLSPPPRQPEQQRPPKQIVRECPKMKESVAACPSPPSSSQEDSEEHTSSSSESHGSAHAQKDVCSEDELREKKKVPDAKSVAQKEAPDKKKIELIIEQLKQSMTPQEIAEQFQQQQIKCESPQMTPKRQQSQLLQQPPQQPSCDISPQQSLQMPRQPAQQPPCDISPQAPLQLPRQPGQQPPSDSPPQQLPLGNVPPQDQVLQHEQLKQLKALQEQVQMQQFLQAQQQQYMQQQHQQQLLQQQHHQQLLQQQNQQLMQEQMLQQQQPQQRLQQPQNQMLQQPMLQIPQNQGPPAMQTCIPQMTPPPAIQQQAPQAPAKVQMMQQIPQAPAKVQVMQQIPQAPAKVQVMQQIPQAAAKVQVLQQRENVHVLQQQIPLQEKMDQEQLCQLQLQLQQVCHQQLLMRQVCQDQQLPPPQQQQPITQQAPRNITSLPPSPGPGVAMVPNQQIPVNNQVMPNQQVQMVPGRQQMVPGRQQMPPKFLDQCQQQCMQQMQPQTPQQMQPQMPQQMQPQMPQQQQQTECQQSQQTEGTNQEETPAPQREQTPEKQADELQQQDERLGQQEQSSAPQGNLQQLLRQIKQQRQKDAVMTPPENFNFERQRIESPEAPANAQPSPPSPPPSPIPLCKSTSKHDITKDVKNEEQSSDCLGQRLADVLAEADRVMRNCRGTQETLWNDFPIQERKEFAYSSNNPQTIHPWNPNSNSATGSNQVKSSWSEGTDIARGRSPLKQKDERRTRDSSPDSQYNYPRSPRSRSRHLRNSPPLSTIPLNAEGGDGDMFNTPSQDLRQLVGDLNTRIMMIRERCLGQYGSDQRGAGSGVDIGSSSGGPGANSVPEVGSESVDVGGTSSMDCKMQNATNLIIESFSR